MSGPPPRTTPPQPRPGAEVTTARLSLTSGALPRRGRSASATRPASACARPASAGASRPRRRCVVDDVMGAAAVEPGSPKHRVRRRRVARPSSVEASTEHSRRESDAPGVTDGPGPIKPPSSSGSNPDDPPRRDRRETQAGRREAAHAAGSGASELLHADEALKSPCYSSSSTGKRGPGWKFGHSSEKVDSAGGQGRHGPSRNCRTHP